VALAGCATAHPSPVVPPTVVGPTQTASTAPGTSEQGTTLPTEPSTATEAPPITEAPPAVAPPGLVVGDPTFPMPTACHLGDRNGQPLPDPACTPGAINPDVTQATIGTTICRSGWTDTVRPSTSVTNRWKAQLMASYQVTVPNELDHLVALSLGGAPLDPRNLWPEPGSIPNPKDAIEGKLNRAVCAGRVTLTAAQTAIATDWTTALTVIGAN
jgi:hypothetical protein